MPDAQTHRTCAPAHRQTPQEKIHHVALSIVAHHWTLQEIPWAKYGRGLAAATGWMRRNLVLAEVGRLRAQQAQEITP